MPKTVQIRDIEIVALPFAAGFQGYFDWIGQVRRFM